MCSEVGHRATQGEGFTGRQRLAGEVAQRVFHSFTLGLQVVAHHHTVDETVVDVDVDVDVRACHVDRYTHHWCLSPGTTLLLPREGLAREGAENWWLTTREITGEFIGEKTGHESFQRSWIGHRGGVAHVAANGRFVLQRRTATKVYVYFPSEGVRFDRLIFSAANSSTSGAQMVAKSDIWR